MCSLSINKGKKTLFPFEMGELYSFFSKIFNDEEKLVTLALESFHSRPVTIKPGHVLSKLLFFESPGKRAKRATVNLDYMKIGTVDYSFAFPFKIIKRKKDERGENDR